MKEKINDFILLLKKDKKTQLGAGLVALAVVVVTVMSNQPAPAPRNGDGANRPQQQANLTLASQESYRDIVDSFSADLATIKNQTQQNAAELGTLRKDVDENAERVAEIFKKVLERIETGNAGARTVSSGPQPVELPPGSAAGMPQDSAADSLQTFGMESPQIVPPAPPEPRKVAFIGAGDSVRIKLLAGVNAPTDGSPYPVVFKLVSDVQGPDGSGLALGEARLIAASQGSLPDQRALFRLTSLNVRLPDGSRRVYEVDGWVVGEDGIRGMPGKLIDPIGKAIGAAGFFGALEGVSQGFAAGQLETTEDNDGDESTVVAGNTAEYAAALGAGSAARAWGGIVRDRIELLVPHVQVLSGREATAVFARSLKVHGLIEAMESTETEDPLE